LQSEHALNRLLSCCARLSYNVFPSLYLLNNSLYSFHSCWHIAACQSQTPLHSQRSSWEFVESCCSSLLLFLLMMRNRHL
jgi:hypothetical protein